MVHKRSIVDTIAVALMGLFASQCVHARTAAAEVPHVKATAVRKPSHAVIDPPHARTQAQASAPVLREVIVTGSRVLTSKEAGALPMRVISASDLDQAGSPSLIHVLQALPEAAGSLGATQTAISGAGLGFEGGQDVNLRGLGPDRTLVLLNGHRLPFTSVFAVNTGLIPMVAISRIELLKDAASATYGSDAMAGVVNFITPTHFNGLKFNAKYDYIRDAKNNYTFSGMWGHDGGSWNAMLAASYQSIGRLRQNTRMWSVQPYTINPENWNFSANPGEFMPVGPVGPGGTLGALGPLRTDVGCATLGGTEYFPGYCMNVIQLYQDLVAPENILRTYGQLNKAFSDDVMFHFDVTYAKSRTRVDYPPSFNEPKPITSTVLMANINPASFSPGTSPPLFHQWWVPMTNPGLAAYAAANPSQFPAGTTGIFIPIGLWRPYLMSGNPLFGQTMPEYRDDEQYRFSADLSGHLTRSIDWDANVTWGQNEWYTSGYDLTGGRIELALEGLGGPNCQWQTAAPGSPGCMWLNPMSNAIPNALIYGITSNPGYDPAVANSNALAHWLQVPWNISETTSLTEANFHLSGVLDVRLPGGKIRWASGFQFLRNAYNMSPSHFANAAAVPCPNSPLDIPGANVCTPTPNTPMGLAVAFYSVNSIQSAYGAYLEAAFPFARGSVATLAGRFEDYRPTGGSAFSPQFRVKWQALNWLALRGSVSRSFRAPPPSKLAPNPTQTLVNVLGSWRSEEDYGNPKLMPEKATTIDLGTIVSVGHFDGALDYYHYFISGILTTEPQNTVLNALFPNGASGANNCSTLSSAFISQHFVFSGPCSAANLLQIKLLDINGPRAQLDGFDLHGAYRWYDVAGGVVALGAAVNHTFSFKFDGFTDQGISVPGFQAAGFLNVGVLTPFPMPKTKATAYLNYARGRINLRWSVRYNSSYTDQRLKPGVPGYDIPGTALNDFAAVVRLPRHVALTVAVYNVFNKFPPLVQRPIGYDGLTSNPLGRYVHVGVNMRLK